MKILVSEDFYRRPAGRYRNQGTYTGEAFREDVLLPLLKNLSTDEKLLVDFTGVSMNGSSFLEEAFGGLIRNNQFNYSKLKDILVLNFPRRPSLEEKVWKYIQDADRSSTS
ncbi:STAS-like domain-containing protein [Acinetobacter sp. WCHA39]|uniref:STAS-like domain-containing protein n=1 Tax=Acinetobacter sp. WCHA39 TaxID=2004648 RepID=UPI000B3CFA2C|nr:STAS-like domain-containing protein [Acinetobacter sp. WCHA39]